MRRLNEAIAKTTTAVKAEGTGILSDIDVQHAMKEKLGKNVTPHSRNQQPQARTALTPLPDIRVLLPCKVPRCDASLQDGGAARLAAGRSFRPLV